MEVNGSIVWCPVRGYVCMVIPIPHNVVLFHLIFVSVSGKTTPQRLSFSFNSYDLTRTHSIPTLQSHSHFHSYLIPKVEVDEDICPP